MRRLAHRALIAALLVTPALAWADGGTLILREQRGALVVTLLAAPTPLRAGEADLDVLVQARDTGEPLLIADVQLRLSGPEAGDLLEVAARPASSSNRLFRGARVSLPSPGAWQVEVVVTDPAGEAQTLRAALEVAPALGPARRHWACIAATPLGLALLALHQVLRLSKPGARSRRHPAASR